MPEHRRVAGAARPRHGVTPAPGTWCRGRPADPPDGPRRPFREPRPAVPRGDEDGRATRRRSGLRTGSGPPSCPCRTHRVPSRAVASVQSARATDPPRRRSSPIRHRVWRGVPFSYGLDKWTTLGALLPGGRFVLRRGPNARACRATGCGRTAGLRRQVGRRQQMPHRVCTTSRWVSGRRRRRVSAVFRAAPSRALQWPYPMMQGHFAGGRF